MKLAISLLVIFIDKIYSRPQDLNNDYDYMNSVETCSTFEKNGYSCVLKEDCKTTEISVRGGLFDLKAELKDEAESSLCTEEGMVCCHDLNKEGGTSCSEFSSQGFSCVPKALCSSLLDIKGIDDKICEDASFQCCHETKVKLREEDVDYYQDQELCSDLKDEGYKCVPNDHCGGLLGVRGADNLICDDKSLTCCHESSIKVPETKDPEEDGDYYGDQELCSDHANDGYKCVPSDHCGGVLDVRGADDLVCEDRSLKCCHESSVKVPDTVDESVNVQEEDGDYYGDQDLCSDHEDEGYKCVPNDHCGGLLNVRGADDLACEDKSFRCCHESSVKIPEEVDDYYQNSQQCSELENEGYTCVPSDQCNGDLLNKRENSLVVTDDLVCKDAKLTCCHESSLKKAKADTSSQEDDYYDQEYCENVFEDGYRCVPDDQCSGSGLINVRGADDLVCKDKSLKCCHESNLKVSEGEDNFQYEDEQLCKDFLRAGFSCVEPKKCGGLLDIRGSDAVCEDRSLMCCHHSFTKGENENDSEDSLPDQKTRSGENLCKLHEEIGYSCVSKESCDKDNDVVTGPREDFTQSGLAEAAECPDSSNQVCCHYEDVTDEYFDTIESCSDHKRDGYSCVPKSECLGLINVRGSNDLICEDTSLTCCHEASMKKQNKCEDHSQIGYRCVTSESCDREDLISGPRDSPLINPSMFQEALADYAACPDNESQVCCHERDIIPEKTCSTYQRDGFSCVPVEQCLDTFLDSTDEGLGIIIRISEDESSNPQKAACPLASNGNIQLCCANIKPIVDNGKEETCKDHPGKECLPLNKCELGSTILKNSDSSSLLDIDKENGIVGLDANANLCEIDNNVCCTRKETPAPPIITKDKPYQPKCGQHRPKGFGLRIFNPLEGKEATHFGEWPHACIIYEKTPGQRDDAKFLGGASLIAPGIVITATHKVSLLNPSSIRVRCGVWNRYDQQGQKSHQDRDVKYVSHHPQFSGLERVENDISLLHLKEAFKLDTHLDTICLPQLIDNREENYDKSDCVIMGWGKSNFYEKKGQNALKQVNLPIVDNNKCQTLLRKTRLGPTFDLDENFLCAGGRRNADACTGDGGGPLVCAHKNDTSRFVLAGVIAWGVGCGEEDIPGVYAAVTDSLCFIDWATKCKHGNEYNRFYDYSSQCGDNWMDGLISYLESDRLINVESNVYLRKAKALRDSCATNN